MHDQILIQPDCVFNLLRARRASKNELHEQESLAVAVAVIVAVRCQVSPTFQAFRRCGWRIITSPIIRWDFPSC